MKNKRYAYFAALAGNAAFRCRAAETEGYVGRIFADGQAMPLPDHGRDICDFDRQKAVCMDAVEYVLCAASEFLININIRL